MLKRTASTTAGVTANAAAVATALSKKSKAYINNKEILTNSLFKHRDVEEAKPMEREQHELVMKNWSRFQMAEIQRRSQKEKLFMYSKLKAMRCLKEVSLEYFEIASRISYDHGAPTHRRLPTQTGPTTK